MTDRETRRLSFGLVAGDYGRYRPAPPPQALDWVVPPGAQAVLDLAAGTGVVTRELVRRAAGTQRIIAVEPDERMRAVLAAGCPEAEVLAGRGEDIPLPDVGGRGGDLRRVALARSGTGRAGDQASAARGRQARRDLGLQGREGALGS